MVISPPLTSEQNDKLRWGLKRAWLAYWILLIGFFTTLPLMIGEQFTVGWLTVAAAAIWLAVQVSRAASATGGTGPIWGFGTLVLGPVGAILLPWLALSRLQK